MSIWEDKIRSYPAAPECVDAGTLDLECILLDEKHWVIDIKTGKVINLKSYPNGYFNWRPQTARYRAIVGAEKNGVIHLATTEEQFVFFDLSDTFTEDLAFFNALREAWYAHPEKNLKEGHVPSVTEVLKIMGFAPAAWTAVNAMRDKLLELGEQWEPEEWIMTPEQIDEARKWGGRDHSQVAKETGSRIHAVIESWLKNKVEPLNSEPDKVVRAYLNFRSWFDENVLEVLNIERTIYGEK
jgi:hypothetical protein